MNTKPDHNPIMILFSSVIGFSNVFFVSIICLLNSKAGKTYSTFDTKVCTVINFRFYINKQIQCVTIEFRQGPIYVVNSHFSRPPNRHKSRNSTKPFWPIFTISESLQMRYCMTLYFKRHQKYDRSKLKV